MLKETASPWLQILKSRKRKSAKDFFLLRSILFAFEYHDLPMPRDFNHTELTFGTVAGVAFHYGESCELRVYLSAGAGRLSLVTDYGVILICYVNTINYGILKSRLLTHMG